MLSNFKAAVFLALFGVWMPFAAWAQAQTVSGIVFDESGLPAAGVEVRLGEQAVETDQDGAFEFQAEEGATLSLSVGGAALELSGSAEVIVNLGATVSFEVEGAELEIGLQSRSRDWSALGRQRVELARPIPRRAQQRENLVVRQPLMSRVVEAKQTSHNHSQGDRSGEWPCCGISNSSLCQSVLSCCSNLCSSHHNRPWWWSYLSECHLLMLCTP